VGGESVERRTRACLLLLMKDCRRNLGGGGEGGYTVVSLLILLIGSAATEAVPLQPKREGWGRGGDLAASRFL
jgi:hypothetical protein